MSVEITGVSGMDGPLHRHDLPGFCKVKQADHPALQFAINWTQAQRRASALILDTVYELDASCLSHMALICNIETMIQTLMGPKREEIQSSVDTISKLARDSVVKGGSSHNNLEQLIEYIRSFH
ncbi:hypothetical protein ACE6H2_021626 [Prunus campanulata]